VVRIIFTKIFLRKLSKIKDKSFREQVDKQIKKIADNPKIGKPMRYKRKRTRELYLGSYRLSYAYLLEEDKIVIINLYHKDFQ